MDADAFDTVQIENTLLFLNMSFAFDHLNLSMEKHLDVFSNYLENNQYNVYTFNIYKTLSDLAYEYILTNKTNLQTMYEYYNKIMMVFIQKINEQFDTKTLQSYL